MARPTIKKQIESPASTAAVYGVTVYLRLIASIADPDAFGYAGTADVDVGGVRTAKPDATGLVTFASVRPNSGASGDVITDPTGTVYQVVTKFYDGAIAVEYISVPDAAGPYFVQDILTTEPGALAPAGTVSPAELTAAVDAALAGLVAGAPGALDTLNELAAALGDDANFAATVTAALATKATTAALANETTARSTADTAALKPLAANPEQIITGAITRDANSAATSAPVTWPDGTAGAYTATTVSSAFPGAVDAWTVTYGSPVTRTYTQPAVTRNASGAVTNRPAITVT